MGKYTEERPWGKFEQFCCNEAVTVKIITVKPNSKLSLQYHNYRDEFWKVIEGTGQIVLGDQTIDVKVGDEFIISKKISHRIITTGTVLKVMEISFGKFDEKDIVRLEDEYKRK
ncbi:MAG: phosphomannose isomerase type II C-terminal cupin domain [Nanoarchaeota archaeon]|nr:phosphomannose isomerase type II C-terminal cupin domain [Nanoarchaeota archaeon]MBU4351696.1 phosphomannose isomerase type II C-terminal cupin domain [Nanoarchaeota archaeon]MBU4456722.1 phosphomannose isomerase type II C-terminal cupin domain [Nanoarchaeota archaeon]MCG2720060.1 phosphomannose isomerase type II C-terminal cupin domain [Nanoarchaeota archaeon]